MPQLIHAGAACAALCALGVHAESYVTLSGGYTHADSGGLEASAAHGFDSVTSTSRSDRRGAWRAGVGHVLSPRVDLELNYSDYGRQELEAFGSANSVAFVPEVLGEHRFGERKVSAWGLDVVLRFPLAGAWSLVARAGPAYATVKWTEALDAPGGIPFGSGPQSGTFTSRARTWAPRGSVGVRRTFAERWDADLSVEYLGHVGRGFTSGEEGTGRSTQTTAWLGLRLRF